MDRLGRAIVILETDMREKFPGLDQLSITWTPKEALHLFGRE